MTEKFINTPPYFPRDLTSRLIAMPIKMMMNILGPISPMRLGVTQRHVGSPVFPAGAGEIAGASASDTLAAAGSGAGGEDLAHRSGC